MKIKRGRRSIFRDKVKRVTGRLSASAARRIETSRKTLASISGRDVKDVTDSDVLEYLVRGHQDSVDYIAKQA